ncbi:uncharacterized protein RAG0_10312 [Rhynchosporium agropyri]|uniref:Uncharacterized protein n=3 Tax=Rhynchosporium TaxID=38037 RepID=A0A1E1MTX0_RHYSE|nr:uncharacterized protein RCO7_14280 [Rhynchosporium commune]CZT03588.1 uncharacterized protein RAG0_10312 [Rhynchosporium agropyri]CZT52511.1 uncharacterized protein RSE6_13858 [Rhynchosporium secalis]
MGMERSSDITNGLLHRVVCPGEREPTVDEETTRLHFYQ